MSGTAVTKDNKAETNGGGAYNSGTFKMDGGRLAGNMVCENGGGVYNTGILSLGGTAAIDGNYAGSGGGVYSTGGSADFKMTGGTVSGNAAYVGGGIYNTASIDVDGGAVTGNTASSEDGGGIYHGTSSPLSIKNATITGNHAPTGNGGGIWIAYANLAKLDVDSATVFSGNIAQYDFMRMAEDDDTYKAQIKSLSWSALSYTPVQGYNNYDIAYTRIPVVFDRNHDDADGWTDADPGYMSVSYGDTISALPIEPARDGYMFNGWNTQADGEGDELTEDSQVLSKRPVTYYAQWEDLDNGLTYKISGYIKKGNIGNDDGPFTITYTITDRTGTQTVGTINGEFKKGGAIQIYYEIPNVPHGATVTIAVSNITITSGNTITYKAFPRERSFYSVQNDYIEQDFEYYGANKTNVFGVIYRAPGSLGPVPVDTARYTANEPGVPLTSVTILFDNTPKRPGYVFLGWSTVNNATVPTYFNYKQPTKTSDNFNTLTGNVAKDAVLYAVWGYEVTYLGNGGLPASQPAIAHEHGQNLKTPAGVSRNGYEFNGWNTKSDGSGGAYIVGTTQVNNSLTLYAQWKVRTDYRVNFNKNFNANTETDLVENMPANRSGITFDTTISEPSEIPVRIGYDFGGWYKDSDCLSEWDFGTDKVGIDPTNLYAKWTVKTYMVTYDANDGTPSMQSGSHDHGSELRAPDSTPEREGYELTGWNTEPGGSGTEYIVGTTKVAGDLTLYAQWARVYTVNFHIISLEGVEGSFLKTWTETTQDKSLERPDAADPSGKGGYPAYYQTPVWYTEYYAATNAFGGDIWDFDNDELTCDIDLYAFDNVAFDDASALRTLDHGVGLHGYLHDGYEPFGIILVSKSFELRRLLTVTHGRTVQYNNIDGAEGAEKIVTANNSGLRHFSVDGTLTLTGGIALTNHDPEQTGGGVSVNSGGTFNLEGGSIRGNKAADGGGVWVSGGTINMASGDITGNVCMGIVMFGGNGGGVYVTDGEFRMSGGTIGGNEAIGYSHANGGKGGGVVLYTSTLTMSGMALIGGNTAYSGGGVDATATVIVMTGESKILDNVADDRGGGAALWFNPTTGDSCTIDMSDKAEISGNESGFQGGGVYIGGRHIPGILRMKGEAAIMDNIAEYGGGGVYLEVADLEMDGGSTIGRNKALWNEDGDWSGNETHGGGVGGEAAIITMRDNSKIIDNEVHSSTQELGLTEGGGGVFLWATSTLEMYDNAAINGNKAYNTRGGGGVTLANNDTLSMYGGSISGNMTDGNGGGVYAYAYNFYYGAVINIAAGSITDNTAGQNGGGVYALDFPNLTIDPRVTFSGNTAGNGAYWIDDYPDDEVYFTQLASGLWDPTVSITVGELKTLHNGTNLPATGSSLSIPPATATSIIGRKTAFSYLANNFDLNFNGTGLEALPNLTTLTVSKTVAGPYADKTRAWVFTVYFEDADGSPLPGDTKFDCTTSGAGLETQSSAEITLDDNGSGVFLLKHDQSIVIKDVPLDCFIRVVEVPNSFYNASYIDSDDETETPVTDHDTGGSNNQKPEMQEMTEERTFDFTNECIATPETGIDTGRLGNILGLPLLAIALGLTSVVAKIEVTRHCSRARVVRKGRPASHKNRIG